MELKDKIIVITGAGSGIGRAMAVRFKEEGAKHIIAVDINAKNLEATANLAVAMTADVSTEADMLRVIEDTERDFGPIDLFCSNAGVGIAPALIRLIVSGKKVGISMLCPMYILLVI